jgi:hypothetical protein
MCVDMRAVITAIIIVSLMQHLQHARCLLCAAIADARMCCINIHKHLLRSQPCMCVPSPPAMAAKDVNRRGYQDWRNWPTYGTEPFWRRVRSEPWNTTELVVKRLSDAGLECPSEVCSATIAADIVALQHGRWAMSMPKTELQAQLTTFKVCRAIMHASPHTSSIQRISRLSTATVLVLFALCARSPYPFLSGAHQGACRCQQRQDAARGLHQNSPSLATRAVCFAP